jgi:hypothetical protein
MPHITHYLPELDSIEARHIEQMLESLSREQSLLLRPLTGSEERTLMQFCLRPLSVSCRRPFLDVELKPAQTN